MVAPKILLLALVFGYFLPASVSPGNKTGVVQTEAGKISGLRTTDGKIVSYKGIPYAEPPIGALRWKRPQEKKHWSGILSCEEYGPSPMQGKPVPFSMWSQEFLIPEAPISEDCLYLNIWSSTEKSRTKRPVLVWIYGGGFMSGGSGVPIYDGEALARQGLVVVSINYRVGVFGFLAHPELTGESGSNASGNYGLMDQVAALQWIRRNIAAFGGDPENVTIAGQSAGAMSVTCLVASPKAAGLFRKAIAQSGAFSPGGYPSLQQAEADGNSLMQTLGCSSLAAMRNLPPATLLEKSQGMRGPITDGYLLPQPVTTIIREGKHNPVSLLTGWNQDEGLLFGPTRTALEFRREAASIYGPDSLQFLNYFPAGNDTQAATSQLHLSRDRIFGLQNYTLANLLSQQGSQVYVYRFARKVPATGDYLRYGAFHTGEVPYTFHNLRFVNRPWQDSDHRLAALMSAYWVRFASTGNPNGKSDPEWPEYTAAAKRIMLFDTSSGALAMPDSAALDFLERHQP